MSAGVVTGITYGLVALGVLGVSYALYKALQAFSKPLKIKDVTPVVPLVAK